MSAADGAGVEIIDTAQAYGDSEARLGALCGEYGFKIVTKIEADLENDYLGSNISNAVKQNCKTKSNKTSCIIASSTRVLLGYKGSAIIRELRSLKDQNIVSKIGISIYSPKILKEISKHFNLM